LPSGIYYVVLTVAVADSLWVKSVDSVAIFAQVPPVFFIVTPDRLTVVAPHLVPVLLKATAGNVNIPQCVNDVPFSRTCGSALVPNVNIVVAFCVINILNVLSKALRVDEVLIAHCVVAGTVACPPDIVTNIFPHVIVPSDPSFTFRGLT
jgi:hypothetical protein